MSPPTQRIGRTTRDWPLFGGIAVVAVALLVAAVKPWAGPGGPAQRSPSTAARVSVEPSATAAPAATPLATPDPASEFCLAPSGWRIMSVERFDGQTIRVWESIEPIAATGPTDPRLRTGLVVSTVVLRVGWCAPGSGPDRPSGAVSVRVWRVDDLGVATRIDVKPDTRPSNSGATYLPPVIAGGPQPDWAPGHYVFAIAGSGDPAGYWFATDVRRYVPEAASSLAPSHAPSRP